MAGGQERVLRRRIRSVQSTKKITKAMELIAASQIVRAQQRIAGNRRYRDGMGRIIAAAAKGAPHVDKRLLGTPESPERVAVLAVVGDRGLSGPYNSSVFRATERLAEQVRERGAQLTLYTVGKKAPAHFRFRGMTVQRAFMGFVDKPTFANAREVAAVVTAPFLAGEVDQLVMVSTRFISAGTQVVEARQLLPLPEPAAEEPEAGEGEGRQADDGGPAGYVEFEPDAARLLAELVPRAVESEVFSALLEGAASFFTAQQRAMAAASDNADELIRTLSRVMNRARQDSITTEIMEIVGGAEALRRPKGA
jgi:F-type H+-transporting ATPase subunit gamma